MSETLTPTLPDVLRAAIRAVTSQIRVALPGRVESYDSALQRVTVKPLVQDGASDESGARVSLSLPVITDVPVVFPGGVLTHPVNAGDTVLVVFASSSIDRWLAFDRETDPGDDRHHALDDAIAIPGLRARGGADAADGATVLAGDDIRLGSSGASDPVARKSDIDSIKSAISGAAVGSGDGGTTFKANIIAAWPSSVGSAGVKVP